MKLEEGTKEWLAKEVAALAAMGEDTTHIWMRLDLSREDVEELYRTPEFEAAMRAQGDDLWEAWHLSQLENEADQTVLQFIHDHKGDYIKKLHDIAMEPDGDRPTQTRILLAFLERIRQVGAEAAEAQSRTSLSPATIHLLNKGEEIFKRHPKKRVVYQNNVLDSES